MTSPPTSNPPPLSPYTPLSRRPQATTVTVKELIAKVRKGEVRIPSFQRPLRWKSADVTRLLDSIWRGYPVGSLLFWKREAEAETIAVGGAQIHAPSVRDAWWVVDGQQRTTALAASLLELDHRGDRRWQARFDPETLTFEAGGTSQNDHCVPVPVLGDLRRLGRWIREHDLEDDAIDRLEEAQQRLLDYSIPAYVVETDDEEALRAVFARLNSSGARMRADEVFQALVGKPSRAHGSLDLDALQGACDLDGFGTPPRPEMLKAVLAMSGVDPTRRPQELQPKDLQALVSYDAAKDALIQTVEFLQKKCRIPHVRLIPYPVVLVILARWFYVHRYSEPATLARLAQWVWRGAATGAHQRAAVSRMRRQIREIKGSDDEASLDRLMNSVEAVPVKKWKLGPFDSRSARSRIETLALLSAVPRDLTGPISLQELSSSGRFAREVVGSQDVDGTCRELARTAANRVLLGSQHTGLSRELKMWELEIEQVQEALSSQLIDVPAFEALQRDDFGTFLMLREKAVANQVTRYLEDRAGWKDPVVRPPRSYIDDESLRSITTQAEAE